MALMDRWYFTVTSDEYGQEEFGPYDTETDANAGIQRIQEKALALADGVEREYSAPYQEKDVHFPCDILGREY